MNLTSFPVNSDKKIKDKTNQSSVIWNFSHSTFNFAFGLFLPTHLPPTYSYFTSSSIIVFKSESIRTSYIVKTTLCSFLLTIDSHVIRIMSGISFWEKDAILSQVLLFSRTCLGKEFIKTTFTSLKLSRLLGPITFLKRLDNASYCFNEAILGICCMQNFDIATKFAQRYFWQFSILQSATKEVLERRTFDSKREKTLISFLIIKLWMVWIIKLMTSFWELV